tara:strand:- start:1004 stop:2536 length:1533 start_codon:yes stop_codon:yes gene_type:complete
MKLLTPLQAYELEEKSIKELPISSGQLMENAGESVAIKAIEMIKGIRSAVILIICGKGNNGGDGFAAGASLKRKKIKVILHSIAHEKNIAGDPLKYHESCKKLNIPITYGEKIPNFDAFELIIDGLIGTGLKGQVRVELLGWINWINNKDSKILSIDVPSGLNASSGNIYPEAVKADTTITFGASKVGMLLRYGPKHCGDVQIKNIGFITTDKLEVSGLIWKQFSETTIRSNLKKPKLDLNKCSAGKVLIIAGSRGMTGAAVLSTMSALRSGAGLTITTSLKSLNQIYESTIIEGLTFCLNDNDDGFLKETHFDMIMEKVEWSDSVLLGPGLGRNKSTQKLIKMLVKSINKPLILDADGLYPFKGKLYDLERRKPPLVITPHFGELSRLIGFEKELIISEFPEILDEIQQTFSHTALIKQIPNCIIKKHIVIVNTTGNQGLATAGTGDILSGIISGLISQGYDPFSGACLGSYIHGKASDILTQTKGFRGQIASDLLEIIPKVIVPYEMP